MENINLKEGVGGEIHLPPPLLGVMLEGFVPPNEPLRN